MTALACGVDVGGTKILGGVVDEKGSILDEVRVTSPATDPDAIQAAIAAVVLELKGRHEISSVGVGAAGYIDKGRSSVMFAPNIAWRDVNLRQGLEKQVELPVVIENDANAAAWGEFAYGAGADVDDLLLVTVGTGVGGGLVLDGALYRGAFGVGASYAMMEPGNGIAVRTGDLGAIQAAGELAAASYYQIGSGSPIAAAKGNLRAITANQIGSNTYGDIGGQTAQINLFGDLVVPRGSVGYIRSNGLLALNYGGSSGGNPVPSSAIGFDYQRVEAGVERRPPHHMVDIHQITAGQGAQPGDHADRRRPASQPAPRLPGGQCRADGEDGKDDGGKSGGDHVGRLLEPALALDAPAADALALDPGAEGLHGPRGGQDVVALQKPLDRRRPGRQGAQDHRSVGNRLVSRSAHDPSQSASGRALQSSRRHAETGSLVLGGFREGVCF